MKVNRLFILLHSGPVFSSYITNPGSLFGKAHFG